MMRWNSRQKDSLFVLFILLLFLTAPLYMNYLPASERLGIFFLENDGIRGPFLWLPLLLHRMGLGIQACCKIFLFTADLGCLLTSFYCCTKVSGNCYAGLAGSFCYSYSLYYIYICMVRGSLGEIAAFVFLPLYGLGMWRLYTTDTGERADWKSGFLLTVGLTGIWLSCVPMAILICGFTLLTAILLTPRTFRSNTLPLLALSLGATILLTLDVSIPYGEKMLSGILYADTTAGASFAARAIQPAQLLSPFQGAAIYQYEPIDHNGDIGLGLPFLLLFLCWGADGFFRSRNRKRTWWHQVCCLMSLCLLSALLSTSLFPWRWLARGPLRLLLEHVGYPWRFLAPAVLCGSMAVSLYGGRIRQAGRKAMALFLLGVTVCNVLSGVYLMDSLLYTTEPSPSYEAPVRCRDAEYVFYISE